MSIGLDVVLDSLDDVFTQLSLAFDALFLLVLNIVNHVADVFLYLSYFVFHQQTYLFFFLNIIKVLEGIELTSMNPPNTLFLVLRNVD